MNNHLLSTVSSDRNSGPLKIAGLYLLIGGLWILFSDQLAAKITSDPVLLTRISLYKGWGYILVTAFLLHLLIRRQNVALRGGEEQLRLITDALPALISYVGADRRYRFSNQAYEEWFGYEAQGKHIEAVLGTAAYKTISGYVDKVLAGEFVTYETEIPYKDGGARFVNATYVPDKGANGHVKGFFALVQDITDSKQAEEELRLWADAFEGCAHGIAIGDPDTNRIVVCNPAFASLHKRRVEDIVGTAILSLHASADHELVRGSIEKADQIGHSRFEASMVRRDRSTFPVQMDVVSVLGNDGDLLHRVFTAVDITERKQAEEALMESEARWIGVIQSAMDAIISVDVEQRIVLFNAAAEKMFGCPADSAIGQTLKHFIPERFRDAHHGHVQSYGATGVTNRAKRGSAVVFGRRSNGDEFPCEASISQIEIAGKKLYTVILRDITDRKQAEEDLRKSEERYRYLFENNPYPMWVYDLETLAFLDVNEAAIAKYGFSRQEFLNMTIADIRPPEDVKRLMDNLARPRQPLEHSEGWRHRLKDRTIIHVEITSHTIKTDGHESALVIAQDITERKRAEQTLQLKDELLHMTSEMAKVGGWEFDATTLKGTWTDEVARIHDLDPAQETNVELGLSYYSGESRQKIEQATKAAIELAKPYDLELEMVTATGSHKWVRTMALPVTEDGRVVKVQGIFQDVTERKQAEQEIRWLNEKLEERVLERTLQLQNANKELEAFSYSVSHDLRAPLRAIDGFTRILLEDYEPALDEEGKRVCAVISREAQHMGQLIDDLLALSRLGRKELHFTKIDMKAMASSVFDELVEEEDPGRIDFRVHRLPVATGDAALIRQAWVNLLSNAIKFSSRKERAVIEVGSKHSEHEYVYYVRDTGAGFDMEYLDKLFGVFQRLHSEKEFEGTGVGLAIVQQVIRRHGGRVWAEGAVDRGATFYFSVPRKRE
jgi:PAS domain S-box-containing protein